MLSAPFFLLQIDTKTYVDCDHQWQILQSHARNGEGNNSFL